MSRDTSQAQPLITHASLHYFKENRVLPIDPGPPVRVGSSEPLTHDVETALQVLFQGPIEQVTLAPDVVDEGLERAARQLMEGKQTLDIGMDPEELSKLEREVGEERADLDVTVQAPVIRLVNGLIADALQKQASDIHFEPGENDVAVRFRVDGILHKIRDYTRSLHPAVVSRIKIMSRLDIAEKLMPQDGRINLKNLGRDIDVRVSVVPAAHGERIVLRLLDKTGLMTLDDLGMPRSQLDVLKKMLARPNGVLLVTGPTGSGKTTSLYAFIQMLNKPDTNIITLEDPVEYKLAGISQIEVKPRIGFTFAAGLRSILRQDPDTISVGEIRDVETADLAVHAALTGHRVLSTLHTNDSIGAVTRLLDLGVQPFLLASSLVGVIAQRLVRKLCSCAKREDAPASFFAVFPEAAGQVKQIAVPAGCEKCLRTGYKGRTGVFELLHITPALQTAVVKGFDEGKFREAATHESFRPLRIHALEALKSGATSLDEVLRIL